LPGDHFLSTATPDGVGSFPASVPNSGHAAGQYTTGHDDSLHHPSRRQRDFSPYGTPKRSRVPSVHRRGQDAAESDAAIIIYFSAINQKNAPPREPRNPFRYRRFEMRAAAPARQGK
jgi:hypothetical protein